MIKNTSSKFFPQYKIQSFVHYSSKLIFCNNFPVATNCCNNADVNRKSIEFQLYNETLHSNDYVALKMISSLGGLYINFGSK